MENWREISEDIVESLLEDGSNPDKLYEVEHHFVCEDFDKLEEMLHYKHSNSVMTLKIQLN